MRKDGPLVSILLPARNAAATLPACVRSIRRQTENDWECVIVDDGSTDDTVPLGNRVAASDPRFVVVRRSARGLVAALNEGLRHCRGRFVARMDADDLMHRERLGFQAAELGRDRSLAAVGCHVRYFPRSGLSDGLRAYERWLNGMDSAQRLRLEAFVECPIAHPTLMVRREVLEEMRYRDLGWPEDYDLILRMLAAGREIGVVRRRLLAWRDHGRRLSRCSPTYGVERFTACKAAFLASGFLSGTRKYVLWGYGDTGRTMRHALLAHDREAAYVVELHPGRIGMRIHGAPVIRPEQLSDIPRLPIVVSVAGAGPRREIRSWLQGLELRESVDFLCAA